MQGGVLLLLSGGGAKAAAHIGVARALAEQGIRPARIIGTSMGAVMGA
jgi:NTE family protein